MRIVSLCPSTTETLIDLGCGPRLVGRTTFCVHPADAVSAIPTVGGTKSPSLDRIRQLEPDLVLLNEEENRREDYEALRAALRDETSFPRAIDDIPGHLRWLGSLVGAERSAEERARQLESALLSLDRAREAEPSKGFRFAYLIWRRPWMAAGHGTYIESLLTRAGGANVLREVEPRYPEVELEALERLGTELVLLSSEPFPFRERHVEEVERLVPSARVELVPGDDFSWHGVRSLRGVAAARALLERQ